MIIAEIYERNARTNPNGASLICDGQVTTHQEFLIQAWQLADALSNRGVAPGKRVAIYAQNCPEYLDVYAAGEISGYITVAVNFRLAPPEVAFVLNDSTPSVVVFEEQYLDIVAEVRAQVAQDIRYICIGTPPDWAESYEDVIQSGQSVPPKTRSKSDEIAHIIYTSGSTRRPKGAMLSHRAQYELARQVSAEGGTQGNDVHLVAMPLFHIGGKCKQLGYAFRGGTIVLHRRFNPRAVAEDTSKYKLTALHLAPVMLQAIMDLPDFSSFDFSSLKVIHYASAPMPVAQLRRALKVFGYILIQHYGMTEIGIGTTLQMHQHSVDGDPIQVKRLGSAGQVPQGISVRIIDGKGRDLPSGESGEVVIRNPFLMTGYWNDMPATLDALKEGWMHTGDIGYLDEEDYLFIVDRKKDMIVSGGENIYPRDVEEALHAHPAISQAAVIGVPDAYWGEVVKAFVVFVDGKQASEEEIISFCKTRIASYKNPKSVEFREELPRLGNLKIDKKSLREPYWSNHSRQVN